MPLAAFAKRKGLSAINLGGFLPLLFGVVGKRHLTLPEVAAVKVGRHETASWRFAQPGGEHWVHVLKEDKPPNSRALEKGAYW